MKIKVKESIRDGRLRSHTDFSDAITDVLPVLFLGLITIYLLIQLIVIEKHDSRSLMVVGTLFLVCAALIALVVKGLIHIDDLEKIDTLRTPEENHEICFLVADKLGWSLLHQDVDHLVFRNPFRIFNVGENITILFDDQKMLINSTVFPTGDKLRSALPIGQNRDNIKKFKRAYNDMAGGTTGK